MNDQRLHAATLHPFYVSGFFAFAGDICIWWKDKLHTGHHGLQWIWIERLERVQWNALTPILKRKQCRAWRNMHRMQNQTQIQWFACSHFKSIRLQQCVCYPCIHHHFKQRRPKEVVLSYSDYNIHHLSISNIARWYSPQGCGVVKLLWINM